MNKILQNELLVHFLNHRVYFINTKSKIYFCFQTIDQSFSLFFLHKRPYFFLFDDSILGIILSRPLFYLNNLSTNFFLFLLISSTNFLQNFLLSFSFFFLPFLPHFAQSSNIHPTLKKPLAPILIHRSPWSWHPSWALSFIVSLSGLPSLPYRTTSSVHRHLLLLHVLPLV